MMQYACMILSQSLQSIITTNSNKLLGGDVADDSGMFRPKQVSPG